MMIGLVLPPGHPWRDEALALGSVDWDGEMQGLRALTRAPVEILLLDTATLAPADLDTLRAYRVQRPDTRIIVSLDETAAPGSPLLAGLVALGIYDLVQGEPLAQAVGHHRSFADAARFSVPDLDVETGRARPRVEVREKIVERRVPLTQRPVLIGVVGLGPGAGTTTLAAAIASYLARTGNQAVLAEYGVPALLLLMDSRRDGKQQWLRGLDVIPRSPFAPNTYDPASAGEPPTPRDLVRNREYPYVIADLGSIRIDEARSHDPDLLVAALTGDVHRYARHLLVRSLEAPENQDYLVRMPGVVIGGGPRSAREVAAAWAGGGPAEILPLPARDSWPPASREGDAVLARVLEPILPDAPRPAGRMIRLPHRRPRPKRGGISRMVAVTSEPGPSVVAAPSGATATWDQPTPRPTPRVSALDAMHGAASLVGSLLQLVTGLIEAGVAALIVAAIVYVALLAWQTADPTGPAGQYLATVQAWLGHLHF